MTSFIYYIYSFFNNRAPTQLIRLMMTKLGRLVLGRVLKSMIISAWAEISLLHLCADVSPRRLKGQFFQHREYIRDADIDQTNMFDARQCGLLHTLERVVQKIGGNFGICPKILCGMF